MRWTFVKDTTKQRLALFLAIVIVVFLIVSCFVFATASNGYHQGGFDYTMPLIIDGCASVAIGVAVLLIIYAAS